MCVNKAVLFFFSCLPRHCEVFAGPPWATEVHGPHCVVLKSFDPSVKLKLCFPNAILGAGILAGKPKATAVSQMPPSAWPQV